MGIYATGSDTIFYSAHKVFNCLGVAILKVMVAILNLSSMVRMEILQSSTQL